VGLGTSILEISTTHYLDAETRTRWQMLVAEKSGNQPSKGGLRADRDVAWLVPRFWGFRCCPVSTRQFSQTHFHHLSGNWRTFSEQGLSRATGKDVPSSATLTDADGKRIAAAQTDAHVQLRRLDQDSDMNKDL
jgi:hypothetical protein